MYHANLFPLTRHEPLPVFVYNPSISPNPSNKPQFYQIIGALAKRLTKVEKKAIVSIEGRIESLAEPIGNVRSHTISIPDVGTFEVALQLEGNSVVAIDQFENYRALVNRLVDVALTVVSDNYYKFHPVAPYIIRDEPYFDTDLINETGIIDSKKYYRTLYKFKDKHALLLNRETELRSYKNLLVEMKCLKNKFETTRKTKINFYDPPAEFINYINSLLKGKAAAVRGYPGPSVREIKEITWKYRAKDITPGNNRSNIQYLQDNYGITNLDENQPLIVYEVGFEKKLIQYHTPEVLSIGHTFEDLERRIPFWQRTQVWGTIHPDCKNQLQKIYGTLLEIDSSLRGNLPSIYPALVEISTQALDVSDLVIPAPEIALKFGNKDIGLKTPYDMEFYRKYSGKKIKFANPMPSIKAMVHVENRDDQISRFLADLQKEYLLRNEAELLFVFKTVNLQRVGANEHDMIITIDANEEPDEEFYNKCKKVLQNKHGKIHQFVTSLHANKDSVMQIIMELSLKFGLDPWLLADAQVSPYLAGVYTYLNPESGEPLIFAITMHGNGKVIEHLGPASADEYDLILDKLIAFNKKANRVLYIFSFDALQLTERFREKIQTNGSAIEYAVTEIIDERQLRLFETWTPKSLPRFGKQAREQINRSPIEAQESAPQGVSLQAGDNIFYLLTGKTIEKGPMKRGCPTPIKLSILDTSGKGWDPKEIVTYVFRLCMMGRASGHMTRFPSPIYYLKSYAHYVNKYGVPSDPSMKKRIFHI